MEPKELLKEYVTHLDRILLAILSRQNEYDAILYKDAKKEAEVIMNLTYNEELKTCSERYIEVKAVPSLNSRFYWSRNEVEQSKKLNDYYYLYLLPISVNVGINIEKLIIIQNPYVEIFNGNQWDSEAEVYKITKNKNAKN